jgi:hypothetical protein
MKIGLVLCATLLACPRAREVPVATPDPLACRADSDCAAGCVEEPAIACRCVSGRCTKQSVSVIQPLREWKGASELRGLFVVREASDLPKKFPADGADFTTETLVGVFLGAHSSGPSIPASVRIVRVIDGENLTVEVEQVYSSTWYKVALPLPVPDPFHVVAIPSTKKAVRFVVNSRDESSEHSRTETLVP